MKSNLVGMMASLALLSGAAAHLKKNNAEGSGEKNLYRVRYPFGLGLFPPLPSASPLPSAW